MNKSDSIGALTSALCKAQSTFKAAKKTAENPFFHSSYATLGDVWDACRESLTANGLAVTQGGSFVEGAGWCLETTLMHTSGEWKSNVFPLKPVKEDPQGYKSANTYALRVGLESILGIPSEDDDGNAASGKPKVGTQAAANYVRDEKLKAAGFSEQHDNLKAEMEAKKAADNPEVNPFSGERYVELPISDKQSKRLYAIAKSKNWTDAEMKKALMDGWGIGHTKEIKGKKLYEQICAFFEGGKKDDSTEMAFDLQRPELTDEDIPF